MSLDLGCVEIAARKVPILTRWVSFEVVLFWD